MSRSGGREETATFQRSVARVLVNGTILRKPKEVRVGAMSTNQSSTRMSCRWTQGPPTLLEVEQESPPWGVCIRVRSGREETDSFREALELGQVDPAGRWYCLKVLQLDTACTPITLAFGMQRQKDRHKIKATLVYLRGPA